MMMMMMLEKQGRILGDDVVKGKKEMMMKQGPLRLNLVMRTRQLWQEN